LCSWTGVYLEIAMLYVICNKFGEPKEDVAKVATGQCDKIQDFGLQDKEGNAVDGYLLTIDGAVHYAIADISSSDTPVEDPPTFPISPEAEPYSD